MYPFKAPTQEILTSIERVAATNALRDWDTELAENIIIHFSMFAEEVLAPLNGPGDIQGAALLNGRVRMPDGFSEAYAQLAADGWQGLTAPEEYGGQNVHPLIAAGISEIFSGANHSFQMVCGLVPGAVRTLLNFGTEEQKSNWIPGLSSGEYLSTMCLTESGAGSDLSRIRTKASNKNGSWKISGEKIFISGGDQDLSEGIFHLVLARTGKPESGLKGLSLFICPSHVGNTRNTISVLRLEKKMGLHASPTCHLLFDDAHAELLGKEGEGLTAMFTMMNYARTDVALQGVGHASRAHQIANEYASTRVQGRTTDGSSAVLSDHADVRRMLDTQKSLASGGRAMCHITLAQSLTGAPQRLLDVLTALCKVYCSEAGTTAADLGIQVLGGYGYLHDYGVEQIWRDARITAIYEGANGIHARSLATRGFQQPETKNAFIELMESLFDDENNHAVRQWCELSEPLLSSENPEHNAQQLAKITAELFSHASTNRPQ